MQPNLQSPAAPARRRKGVALITVISVLALATVLLLALFSTARTEYKSTRAAVNGAWSRIHSDSVVNIVIGQIQRATHQDAGVSGIETWTSQPGMVRQYRQDGVLLRGNKLYSDSKMVASTEAEIAADVPPSNWDTMPDQYVDMNEPVVRFDPDNPSGQQRLFFPILDPRAYSQDPSHSVEGFTYSTYSNGLSGTSLDGVVLPDGSTDGANQRLPMPVEWLYYLKDGTLGYLDNGKRFVGAAGQKATRDNPIVARVAFWTDDESCKININTAGESTYWDTPRLFHERDSEWARFQPMAYEYQRYPGHPATVCMSTVLFPNQDMNPLNSDPTFKTLDTAFTKARDNKEVIYDLMPKILPGGSKAGSVPVPAGRNFTPTDFAEVQKALGERLFASTDEFLLRPTVGGSGKRDEIDLGQTGIWSGLKRAEVVERLRPFLTPRSRAPETNPFGLPKICMWPINRTDNPQYRTVFDRTIAYCSRLANQDYFFTRSDCTSQTELSSIPRNKRLFDYLMALTSLPIPGFGASNATFEQKYGDNREEILVEMFDYIRSTNLYDDNLAEQNVGDSPSIPGLPDARLSAYASNGGMKAHTFTPLRNSGSSTTGTNNLGSYPGHGQVMPSVLPKSKTEVYRGMGRFLTISEFGLQFIACAEGTTTAGGKSTPKLVPTKPPAVTGYTPPTWKGLGNGGKVDWGDANNWYSNFPPLSGANQDPAHGFYKTTYPSSHQLEGIDGDKANYPGYKPANWNWTLETDKPLPANTRRVQASILLEWFCPSTGWTLINPDLQFQVDVSQLKIDGRPMFPMNNGKILVKPYAHMSSAWGVYPRGGTISYRATLQGRKLPGVRAGVNKFTHGSLLDDTNYGATSGKSGIVKDSIQYNLVSDFFDVPVDPTTGKGVINFQGGTVIVNLYATNASTTNPQPLQTFNFKFPAAGFPAPTLATKTQDTTWSQNFNGTWNVYHPVPAPYWWAFNADGALGRDKGGVLAAGDEMGGRFRFVGSDMRTPYGDAPGEGYYYRGNLGIPDDTIQSLVLKHGDPRLVMGQYIVPDDEFIPHRDYGQKALAHNIVFANWSDGPGLDHGLDKKDWRLVKGANYANSFLPDHPYTKECAAGLQKYGDFDRGISNQTDGAYINKPDEGNTYGVMSASTGEQAVPYFTDAWVTWLGGATYFSPNRQIASPGMFGSLPTGVEESSGTSPGCRREAWRTLLFRPQLLADTQLNLKSHIGAPKYLRGYVNTTGLPIQGVDPPDYLFMDFFWMPVVEPYAISEPGSTAGKINLNYEMAPFRHIRRATGLAAVLKSEEVTAVPFTDANVYLTRPGGAPSGQTQTWFWKEDNSTAGKKFWHRQMDVEATLKLFDERFRSGFAFISPAQICEMYLLPKKGGSLDTLVPDQWPNSIKSLLTFSNGGIFKFWRDHAITADNLKERPYTNIYPRVTTRSNTFKVHMRIQTIHKARSTDPGMFVSGADSTGAEYRGSAVVERYLDLNDPAFDPAKGLDFATTNPTSKPSLDDYHRFRVIAQQRFDP